MLMTKRGTVLILSDNSAMASLIQRNIGGRGYEVASGKARGEGFAKRIAELAPDLIIVDIEMPLLSGIGLSLRIRQISDIPILMLTTWGADEDKVRYLDLSADTYLTEPVTVYQLAAQIDDIVKSD